MLGSGLVLLEPLFISMYSFVSSTDSLAWLREQYQERPDQRNVGRLAGTALRELQPPNLYLWGISKLKYTRTTLSQLINQKKPSQQQSEKSSKGSVVE